MRALELAEKIDFKLHGSWATDVSPKNSYKKERTDDSRLLVTTGVPPRAKCMLESNLRIRESPESLPSAEGAGGSGLATQLDRGKHFVDFHKLCI
jgi:hypothetical protein